MSYLFAPEKGVGGALREVADRVVGDAVQAQPHEEREDVRAGQAPHDARGQRVPDARHAVVRADPRRQRQPEAHPLGGVPHGRRHPPDTAEHLRGTRGVPEGIEIHAI